MIHDFEKLPIHIRLGNPKTVTLPPSLPPISMTNLKPCRDPNSMEIMMTSGDDPVMTFPSYIGGD